MLRFGDPLPAALVRQATVDDADALARLAKSTFMEMFVAENSKADMDLHCKKHFSADIQRHEILDPNCATIVADLDDELVAFAQVRLYSPKQGISAERPSELHRLYVSTKWHGKGVAHQTMSRALATAAHSGADYIWLGVWEHNPKAIAFYRKYGFKVVGEHVFKMGEDPQRDLVMALEIDKQRFA
jgi:ribosomal protein S18 acetylase RimI-like enzyme